jgi:sulfur carrier protein
MSGAREVSVNGEPRPLREETVADLLAALGYAAGRPGIAVAVNGEVVRRGAWGARRLSPGDRIDIVGAVQGG